MSARGTGDLPIRVDGPKALQELATAATHLTAAWVLIDARCSVELKLQIARQITEIRDACTAIEDELRGGES